MGNDTNPPADPQAGDTGDPQPQAGTTSTDPQAGDSQSEVVSLEEARKLRSEANSLRQRLRLAENKAKEFDEFKTQIEQQNMSQTEKLQKQLADLQTQHNEARQSAQDRILNYEVMLQAAAAGINPKHMDKAARLIWDDIEVDDDGMPTNVEDLFKQLLSEMPELLSKAAPPPPPTSGGATNPARSQTQAVGEITDTYIAQLTPQAYSALSPEMKLRISQYMQQRAAQRR